jgi:uncharacterized membrane protein YhaH (DUF805 family)
MKGRINRAKYNLANIIITILILALYGIGMEKGEITRIVLLIPMFLLFYFDLCLSVKRLHDIGKSGKYLFGIIIPIYSFFLSIILTFKKGQQGMNKYGEDPLEKNIIEEYHTPTRRVGKFRKRPKFNYFLT